MGRATLMEDFAPVPTEAATQAVPTQEVCVPTQDILASSRPRTLEEWVNVGQQVKRSRRKSTVKPAPKEPPSKRARGGSRKADVKQATQKIAEDSFPPTQRLAEEICPTQQLIEPSEAPAPTEQLDIRLAPVKAYRRRSKRRGPEEEGPTAAPKPSVASPVELAPEVPKLDSAAGQRLSFQEMVSLGRRLRGKQAPAEEDDEGAACEQEPCSPCEPEPKEATVHPPQPRKLREESDGPHAVTDAAEEVEPAVGPKAPEGILKALKVPTPSRGPRGAADSKAPKRAPLALPEPAECPEDGIEGVHVGAPPLNLRGLVRKHIAEVQEALRREQAPFQKVLEVYEALETSL